MKKPTNRVALALFVFAAVSVVLNSVELWSVWQNLASLRHEAGEETLPWATIAHATSSILANFGLLVGLGTLIEIADRILWHVRKAD